MLRDEGSSHFILVAVLATFLLQGIALSAAPEKAVLAMPKQPVATMIGYTKVALKWEAVSGASSYKILRDGKYAGSAESLSYEDLRLTPGGQYSYCVVARGPNGEESPKSKELVLTTEKTLPGREGQLVANLVDTMSHVGLDAKTIVRMAKEALGKMGQNVSCDFSTFDPKIVAKFIDDEIALLSAPDDGNAASSDSGETLEQFMEEHYKGHSFNELYLRAKLTELAEAHQLAGKTEAAIILHEKSLSYLSDNAGLVFVTLWDIGRLKAPPVTLDSKPEEILASLKIFEETMLRYYAFQIRYSEDDIHPQINRIIAGAYARYFPLFLKYGHFDMPYFNKCKRLVASMKEKDEFYKNFESQLDGWRVSNVKLSIQGTDGKPVPGMLVVKNRTVNEMTGRDDYDTRACAFASDPISVEIHVGHDYEVSTVVPDVDGNPIAFIEQSFAKRPGERAYYRIGQRPVVQKLPSAGAPPELVYVLERPKNPYYVVAEDTAPKKIKLKWLFSNPEKGYKLREFKICRNGVEVGRTPMRELANLSLDKENTDYTFTVVAIDANGTASPESLPLVARYIPPLDDIPMPGMPSPGLGETQASQNSASPGKSSLGKNTAPVSTAKKKP